MRKKGFTLIELVIAVILVGVLSTIGMVMITNVVTKNKIRAVASEVLNIRNEMAERFRASGQVSWTRFWQVQGYSYPLRLRKLPVCGGYYELRLRTCPRGFGSYTGDVCLVLYLRNSRQERNFIRGVVDEINRRLGTCCSVEGNNSFMCVFPNSM